jgi:transcriptional regulator with XRE-family HTH domain
VCFGAIGGQMGKIGQNRAVNFGHKGNLRDWARTSTLLPKFPSVNKEGKLHISAYFYNMGTTVSINHNLLTWAIRRAGYDIDAYTSRYTHVAKWLKGEKQPTIKQLEDFAKKVHVPFGYLFLPTPPIERLPIPFFRTRGNWENGYQVNLYDTILLIQKRQAWLSEYLQENDYNELPFVGKYGPSVSSKAVVDDMRKVLGLSEDWASKYPNWERAFSHLLETVEQSGIVTVFNGVVENNAHFSSCSQASHNCKPLENRTLVSS